MATSDKKNLKNGRYQKYKRQKLREITTGQKQSLSLTKPKMAPQDLEEGKYFFGDELVFEKHKE